MLRKLAIFLYNDWSVGESCDSNDSTVAAVLLSSFWRPSLM